MTSQDPVYPLGRFEAPAVPLNDASRAALIEQIAEAPEALRRHVAGLSDAQLEARYRDGGWTIRQIVHHLPDSHINGYVRFKLALTEDAPEARGYHQADWADLPDARSGPVGMSLDLLAALHARCVACLRALPADAFGRMLKHPRLGLVPLDHQLALYAWHGRHHVAQIAGLLARKGWT